MGGKFPGRRTVFPGSRLSLLVLPGLLVLGACSEVPDWANPVEWYHGAEAAVDDVFNGEESGAPPPPQNEAAVEAPVPGAEDDFPKLASVPESPPPTSSADDLDALMAELVADRENAQYTDEEIRIEPLEEGGLGATAPSAPETPSPEVAQSYPSGEITIESVPYEAPAYEAPSEPYQPPTPVDVDVAQQSYEPAPEPTKQELEVVDLATAPERAAQPSLVTAALQAPTDSGVYSIDTLKQIFDKVYDASLSTTYTGPVTAAYEGGGAAGAPTVVSDAPEQRYAPAVVFQAAVIYFDNGQAWLPSDAGTLLDDVVALHKRYGGKIRVVGHASMRTRDMDLAQHRLVNFQISADRAQAVADALMRKGVPASAVLVSAEGDNDPVTYEYMPAGERENRRTEVFIEY